ncbi:hypothetical protein EG329_008289 [Mollisiaceae sp. DMI_Dod_QoI]|nr:hypothetical protein EG329_008289 [Helotiales sp. DMI_Dod_QoI]
MSRQPPAKRAQRLQEIAQEVGAILVDFDPSPLLPPPKPPSFMVHDDDRKADSILVQLRVEESASKQQSRRLSSAFGKSQKPTVYSYTELYQAMIRAIEENERPGVLEVLLKRFKAVEGDINLARRGSTSMVKRVRGKEEQDERGRLLYVATGNCRVDFVQLLAPLADEQSLNESLDVALAKRELDIVELLVRYGANTALYEPTLINVAKHGDHELLELLLRAKKRVSQPCLDRSLLPATNCGSLLCILLLAWAGANTDYGGAAALMHAVEAERVDLATALIAAPKPPSGPSLDKALNSVFAQPSSPSPATDGQYLLTEALLCGGPVGDAANQGLLRATFLANVAMMQLLLSHQVDINFDGGCAVGHAIQRNRCDLMGTLLQSQTLTPDIASELVCRIPVKVSPMDRVAMLSKLLVNGASGAYCSQQLILAAESNDLDTAQLLLTYGSQNNGPPVCSVNYNGARCLKIAVSRNHIQLLKLLALEGDPSKFSLSQAFSAIPPNVSGDDQFIIVQTLLRGGAEGPEVDEALHSAVTAHRKSHRLMEVLVQFKANVTEPTLLAAVSQGSTKILDILLAGNVSSSMCATAIATAMKLPRSEARFKIISKLLAPTITSNAEVREVSQAAIEILQNCPEDLELLDLLCRKGKANLNFENGLAVFMATKNSNFTLLKIVLGSGNFLPTSATIERSLECAINLPTTDASRDKKVKGLLWKVKPQSAMNKALIQEVKSTLRQGQHSPVIQILLDAGADVNAEEGMPLRLAVSNPAVMDLVLSKRPNIHSLSLTFPAALRLKDPARFILCEKLLRAGAAGEEISKALHVILEEGPSALALIRLILPHTDVNYNQGHALRLVVQRVFIEALDLLLSSRASVPSLATRVCAFQEAMKLKNYQDRYEMVQRLLKTGIPQEVISDALISAVNLLDLQLAEIILRNGGSVEHKGGQAVCSAASAGNTEILRLLVSSKTSLSTLVTGFGGAMSLHGEPYYQILQILLEAGLRGEAVDEALIESVRQGDSSLKMSELLCRNGASVEWNEGEATVIAARSAMIQTLNLLLKRQPSQGVLRRAYIAASTLVKEPRLQVIERLLTAGKTVDNYVTKTLTTATTEVPSDRQMIKMLLARNIFDEGQSMIHAARVLDLRTLSMLLSSPKAINYINRAFEAVLITDDLWRSATGLAVVKILLEKGAVGAAVAEALYQAIASLENTTADGETIADDFVEAFLKFGADVNYQRGLALQRATLQANIPLVMKLLPGANQESKAMAIPYVFTVCEDKSAVLKGLAAFTESFDNGEEGLDVMFRHPDEELEPVLFLALGKFPRDTQILRTLLDMGYPPNQWRFRASDMDIELERWPILCWALEQPQKKISTSVIHMLIDAGADVNYTSKAGITPLMLAIQNQRVDVVSKLISMSVNVTAENSEGITPLALASSMNNIALMECLLEADAEVDDGSLHDVTRELQLDKVRILIKYGHRIDYPSDRHEGRSALAELCLRAVDSDPTTKQLEKTIQFLINNDAKIGLRNVSGKTIFHYALDSSNPVLILTAMLKIMWEHVNADTFLYSDKTYTYSLTKYVEKDLYQGPRNQKDEILTLFRKKQAIDRYWAHDIMATQPADCCNPPPHIEEEVLRQKARAKRQAEMREDASYMLDLKRMTAIGEVEIQEITAQGELQRAKEKARVDRELLEAQANTQLQITEDAFTLSSRLASERRMAEVRHQKQLGDVQVNVARQMRQEDIETDRSKNMMQIEYLDKKIEMENGGFRQRLAIEEQAKESFDRVAQKGHDREMARIKMQKQLLGQQQSLANTFQGGAGGPGFPGQRQIGYISET